MNMPADRTSKHPHRRKTQSFSSSLLDSIFRSIDDDQSNEYDDQHIFYQQKPSLRTKQDLTHAIQQRRQTVDHEIPSLRREIMKEKWTENRRNRSRTVGSYSSSSGSSSGATFSSSETESTYRSTPPSSNQHRHAIFPSPTEIATCFEQTPKREGKFMRTTKLRALKIYSDLKKVKQPISPGGRISNFLNSILGSRTNLKKSKLDEPAIDNLKTLKKPRSVKDSIAATTKTCSSFSRSCLSKTPPPLQDVSCSKRSVRFYPVSVIVDEDSRPCGEKSINGIDPNSKNNAMRNNIWSYQPKNVYRNHFEEDEDDDDDDADSCASSDLFELEIVGGVGIGAYREELPVFGTTNLKTNLAIANGLTRQL